MNLLFNRYLTFHITLHLIFWFKLYSWNWSLFLLSWIKWIICRGLFYIIYFIFISLLWKLLFNKLFNLYLFTFTITKLLSFHLFFKSIFK